MDMPSQKQIITFYIKHSGRNKPLKILAFAQLSLKALFLSDKGLSTEEVAIKVAKIIEVKGVSERLIEEGIESLLGNSDVEKINGRWALSKKARERIEKEIGSFQEQTHSLLERHFPTNKISPETLNAWFSEASADFFGRFSNEWVRSICKNAKKAYLRPKTIDQLLNNSIIKYGLSKFRKELANGFFDFLSSDNTEDHRYLMQLGFAMFTSRLVAADIGADPITLKEIRNSNFLLDTNFIFSLILESPKFSKLLSTLGPALKSINPNLIILYETKEEYKRVINGKENDVMSLLKKYPKEIIKGAYDYVAITAKRRGCNSEEDFERFFNDIRELPESIPDGPKINIGNDDEIEREVEEAKKDKKLKKEIQYFCNKLRPPDRRLKSENALNHDSAIIHVAEFIRKNREEKCWIISIDKTLQACCNENTDPNDTPLILSADALIQILALDSAGPSQDPNNFAPLLANIILKKCTPPTSAYTLQDLHWLNNINSEIPNLPPERIRRIIRLVTKARIEGKTMDDKSLQLNINRAFEKEKISYNQELEESRERARKAEEEAQLEKKLRREAEEKAKESERMISEMKIDQLKNKERRQLVRKIIFRVFIGLTVGIIFYIFSSIIPETEKYNLFFFAISSLISIVAWVRKPYKDYRDNIANLELK